MDKPLLPRIAAPISEFLRARGTPRSKGDGRRPLGSLADADSGLEVEKCTGEAVNVRFYTDFNVCNYSCRYCVAGQYDKESLNTDWDAERFYRIVDNLTRLPFRTNIRLGVGGEFFLNEDLIEGARILSRAENVTSLNLITNLSFSIRKYKEFFSGFDITKVGLVASYHPSEVKNRDRFIKTARFMDQTVDFMVILVGYPPHLEDLPALRRELKSHGLEVFVQAFVGWYEGKEYPYAYTAEEKALLREIFYSEYDYEYLVEAKKPGLCNSGYKSFYVDMSGVVIPCGMGIPYEPMGNLAESPEIDLHHGPQMCRARRCLCDTENMNTVEFENNYVHVGLNQHKYVPRESSADNTTEASAIRTE
jgi:MoaA/NifB/PqqE/SkfB family radical SAM enzyme